MDFDSMQDDGAAPQQPVAQPSAVTPQASFDSMVDDNHAAPHAGAQFDTLEDDADKYGGLDQQVKAGLEGFAQGVAGPLAPYLETKVGTDPEDIKGRESANPWTHGLAQAAGFGGSMLTGTGEAALVGKAGEAVAGALGGGKIAQGAAKMATEMGLLGAGDEVTKYILDAPTSVSSAAANIGLSALLGGATGGVFSGLGILGKKGIEALPEGLTEFTDRLKNRMVGASPAEALQNEMEKSYNLFKDAGHEISGVNGVKASAVNNLVPEWKPEISNQVSELKESLLKATAKHPDFKADLGPLIERLESVEGGRSLDPATMQMASKPVASGDAFQALDSVKKQLGEWGKYNKELTSLKEQPFRNTARSLGGQFKEALENTDVWGEAGKLQKNLNEAWSDSIGPVKNFQSKFMTKFGPNDYRIDGGKIERFLTNESGKTTDSSARKAMLEEYVNGIEKFQKATNSAYEAAGMESPHPPIGLSAMRESLEKASPWAKAADAFYEKGMTEAGGKLLGGAAGYTIGEKSGLPGAGYAGLILGGAAGGHLIPGILQGLLEKPIVAKSFQKAIEFSQAAIKGDKMLSKAAEGVFKAGAQPSLHFTLPNAAKLDKLDKQLEAANNNPQKFQDNSKGLEHYMPGHAAETMSLMGRSAQYLNSIKPKAIQANPMDTKQEPTEGQMNEYRRQLSIAEQPLQIMQHIKDGSLQARDIATLSNVAPAMRDQMIKKLSQQIADYQSEGGQIPYRVKQSLSLFMGTPLDSTMTPAGIQAAQSAFIPKQAPQAPGGKAKGSPSKMSTKGASQYKTADQSAESDRSGRD